MSRKDGSDAVNPSSSRASAITSLSFPPKR
jgi:hypothetical protein